MDTGFILRVAAAALSSFDAVMADLGLAGGKNQGREYLPLNPKRNDQKTGSFTINRDSGKWSDFAASDAKGGDLVSLAAYLWDLKQGEAADRLGDMLNVSKTASGASTGTSRTIPGKVPAGVCVMPIDERAPKQPKAHPTRGKPSKIWAYLDSLGKVQFYHCRFEPNREGERKEFSPLTLWRKESGKLEWQWKSPPDPRPLYGLDKLASMREAPVCIVEGEKAADAAALLLPGHVVMCWQGGAQAISKSDWRPLAGRDVILWPDSDEPGRVCMEKLCELLKKARAKSVKVINLEFFGRTPGRAEDGDATLTTGPALEAGDDAADLLNRGWSAAHFELLKLERDFMLEPSKVGKSDQAKQAGNPAKETAGPAKRSFLVDDIGVHVVDVRDGAFLPARWFCARLEVLAMVRDPDNHGWGLLLHFLDHDGKPHREIIPARDFRGEGMEVAERLLDRGLAMAPKARPLLLEYLQTSKVEKRARITPRTGWHGDGVFVLPESAYGAKDEEWIFQSDSPAANNFRQKGTIDGWRDGVGRLCSGNSRLLFAVSLAFASPLLHLAGAESGGFHYRSNSSDGKTSALRVAASVCGGPDYMQRWRATDNGLEALAMQHCDAPLLLDELAQLDPKAAGEVAYMLANGSGKVRAARTGGARDRASWRLLFLSAGEIGLAQHMAEAGKTPRAGQELRLAEIPADAGEGFGVFETLHDYAGGSDFAKALDQATRQNFGVAFPAFLERLTSNLEGVADTLKEAQKVFEKRALGEDASGQARRVASRFAVVGAAGELATNWGITGWEAGEAIDAASKCFKAWIAGRGGEGLQEERAILSQVREFLRRYAESAFTDWERPAVSDNHAAVRSDRAGYRKCQEDSDEIEFFIFVEVFKSRVCKGFDHAAVGRLLLKLGYVEAGTEKDRLWTRKIKLPAEGRARVVHIKQSIWDGDDA